jgi:hypothetical protein
MPCLLLCEYDTYNNAWGSLVDVADHSIYRSANDFKCLYDTDFCKVSRFNFNHVCTYSNGNESDEFTMTESVTFNAMNAKKPLAEAHKGCLE